jgi:hypothetical protein
MNVDRAMRATAHGDARGVHRTARAWLRLLASLALLAAGAYAQAIAAFAPFTKEI